jgi:hypothetical protein
MKTKAKHVKIGGGNATGAVPGRISNLSNVTNTATMMKKK